MSFARSIEKLALVVALGFGSGLSPKAPGTVGSLLALGIFAFLHYLGMGIWEHTALVIGIAIIGTWAIHKINRGDAKEIVVDEFLGMGIVLLGSNFGWQDLLMRFALFRFFDIAKPFGIRWLDRQKNWGAVGVMADDALAGIYSLIALEIFLRISIKWVSTI